MNTKDSFNDLMQLQSLKKSLKYEIVEALKINNKKIKKKIIKRLVSIYKDITIHLKLILNEESINLESINSESTISPIYSNKKIVQMEELLNSNLSPEEHTQLENRLNVPHSIGILSLITNTPQYESLEQHYNRKLNTNTTNPTINNTKQPESKMKFLYEM
jgi:hypothetical protein